MEDLFKDIMNISGVQGIVLLSNEGNVAFDAMTGKNPGISKRYLNWRKFIEVLDNAREADFVFENGRIYLRQTGSGYLLITMLSNASIAMVKLNCDIVLPQLANQKGSKGIKGFFKR
jgi:hypothetical protein